MLKAQASLASASVACTQAVAMVQLKFTSAQLYSYYSSIIGNKHKNVHVRAPLFEVGMNGRGRKHKCLQTDQSGEPINEVAISAI